MESVTRQEFINRYDKEETQKQIKKSFKVFDIYLQGTGTKESDLIAQLKQYSKSDSDEQRTEVYRFLDRMQRFWAQDRHSSTVRIYFNMIKMWLQYNGISIETHQVRRFVRFAKATRDRPQPITRQIIQKLLDNSPLKYKVYFLVAATAGPRGKKELLNLKVRDIDFKSSPTKLTIPKEFAKNGIERITFLTPECTRLLRQLIELKGPDDDIFDFGYSAVHNHLGRIRESVGMTDKTANGRFHHLRIHKLRKFCETNISNSQIPGAESDEFAHAILGHEKYLMTYYETPDDEMARMYSSAIPRLTIIDKNT